jgi:hypothetical protein
MGAQVALVAGKEMSRITYSLFTEMLWCGVIRRRRVRMKLEPSTLELLIKCVSVIVGLGLVAAAAVLIIVGREAFRAHGPSPARAFGHLFVVLPALSTIVLIVAATAVLTAMEYLKPEGCVAIFSSIASFVLGAESQKRREFPQNTDAEK